MNPVVLIFKYFWAIGLLTSLLNTIAFKVRSHKFIQKDPKLEEGYDKLIRGYAFGSSLPWLVMGIGILSGHVSQVFDFFRPREGNPYVLSFFVCVVLEWVLLLYWIFLKEGAEKLCQYRGVFGRGPFTDNPTFIKVMTVLCILGGIAAFTMMWTINFPVPRLPQ